MSKLAAKARKLFKNPKKFFYDMFIIYFIPSRLTDSQHSNKKKDKAQACYMNNMKLTHVDDNIILFESFWGRKIGCNPYAVYCKMLENDAFSNYTFILIKRLDIEAPEITKRHANVKFVEPGTPEYAEYLLKAGILITNSTFPRYFVKRQGQRVYNFWHGIPLKHMGRDSDPLLVASSNTQRNFLMSDAILLSSQYAVNKTIIPYDASCLTLPRAKIIGSPRIDKMLNSDSSEIKSRLCITADSKIILYAPTWRGTVASINRDIEDQLDAIAAISETISAGEVLFLSIHNYTRNNLQSFPVDGRMVPDDIDINEFLSIVDILITDFSSIFIDFLPLDRPVILHVPDRVEYEKSRGIYIPLEDLPVAISNNLHELKCAINKPNRPSSYETYNKYLNTLLPYEDGHAANRAIELIFSSATTKALANEKKRILIFPGSLKNNGITTSFLNLMNNIDFDVFDVIVAVNSEAIDKSAECTDNFYRINRSCQVVMRSGITNLTPDQAPVYKKFREKKYKYLTNKDKDFLFEIFKLEARRVFGDTIFDIAVDFCGYAEYWSMLLSHTNAHRKCIYLHNDMEEEHRNKKRKNINLISVFNTYKYYDILVCVSEGSMKQNKNKLQNYYSSRQKMLVVPNSINIEEIIYYKNMDSMPNDATIKNIFLDNNLTVFGTAGRLSSEKNHSMLLNAFAQALKTNMNAVLLVIGGGVLENELKEQALRLNISRSVVFSGHIKNPLAVIGKLDCFLLPSLYEGQPMVLLEAMSLGVPCIGSQIPSIESVLKDKLGITVPLDVEAWAKAIENFYYNRECRVYPRFDANVYNNDALQSFYENVCGIKVV